MSKVVAFLTTVVFLIKGLIFIRKFFKTSTIICLQPKIKKDKSVRLIHPNSRKALQISREKQKSNKRTTRINDKATKLDVKVKKLLWFQENMKEDLLKYELSDIKEVVTE